MSITPYPQFDPSLDLVLVRRADVSLSTVWRAWTEPELLMKWFCPRPWKTVECEIELRPGGKFFTVMESPDGDRFPGTGCVLEVQAPHRFVWTSALLPGFRPLPKAEGDEADMLFTAIVQLEEIEGQTQYTAIVIHGSPESRKKHDEMGFSSGWSAAFDQLVELAKKMDKD